MKDKKRTVVSLYVATLTLLLTIFSMSLLAVGEKSRAQDALTPQEKQMVALFNERVKNYLEQRNQARKKVPKLSKDSSPEQIEANEKAFVAALQAARANAKPGDVFSEELAKYFRTKIRSDIKGQDRQEVRETILEADTKGVPLKVNYPYPESKELTEVPATLLLRLPQLPKEVKYRFVRRHMLLVDTDNGLIVDYMLNALP